jgi:hypothetical protein
MKEGIMKPPFRSVKVILIALAIFLPGLAGSTGVAHAAEPGAVRISYIQGDAQVYDEQVDEWAPASINMPLAEGARAKVRENSTMEIQVKGGTVIRLAENSSLEVRSQEFDDLAFFLKKGRAYVNAQKTYSVRIDTPDGSAKSWSQSVFKVDSGDRNSEVSVLEGYVDARVGGGESRNIRAGDRLIMDQERSAQVLPLEPADSWERWNRDRDRALYASTGESDRYLPEELHEYSSDLDRNGEWRYIADYGYVWRPTVVVSAGWAPYRVGRWGLYGRDYVWISYEPWGWAPYHYGRWAYVPWFGWCWVPPRHRAVYWAPAWVGWVNAPDYVAWVPLAPGEIYYSYGRYGPTSVNVNIDVDIVRPRTVYRNVYVNNSVTVIHRDTFVKGRQVTTYKVKENPFLSRSTTFGPPKVNYTRSVTNERNVTYTRNPRTGEREIKYSRDREVTREFNRSPVKEKDRGITVTTPDSRRTESESRKSQTVVRIPENERGGVSIYDKKKEEVRIPGRDRQEQTRMDGGKGEVRRINPPVYKPDSSKSDSRSPDKGREYRKEYDVRQPGRREIKPQKEDSDKDRESSYNRGNWFGQGRQSFNQPLGDSRREAPPQLIRD